MKLNSTIKSVVRSRITQKVNEAMFHNYNKSYDEIKAKVKKNKNIYDYIILKTFNKVMKELQGK